MKPLLWSICSAAVLVALAWSSVCAALPEKSTVLAGDEATEGFYPLFNGTDLDGWYVRGANKEAFRVENGVLAVTGAPDGDWLFTNNEYENFVLRLEFRLEETKPGAQCNSGVAIRAPKEGDPAYVGMEIQVLRPDWEIPWQRAGALYHTVPPQVQAQKKIGEWNTMEILCDGSRIRTTMNDQVLYDIKTSDYATKEDWRLPLTDRPMKGHIGLQDHTDRVEYRNIRIKPLPGGEGWRPLFNGKNLDGWRVDGDPVWHVGEDGVLTVDGRTGWDLGRNALCTDGTFGDFEMRLSVRPHDRANSGIFFRCKGDEPWPKSYEAQIDNHDPKQFTGALWDLARATDLRGADNRWFQMHIVADGRHVQVAVNGKIVTDYTASFMHHVKYPSGWIALQGHDPGSVVDFKDIEIKELSKKP